MRPAVLKKKSNQIYLTCPVCGGYRLGVAVVGSRAGAYNCWTNFCNPEDIKKAWRERYGSSLLEDIETLVLHETGVQVQRSYSRRLEFEDFEAENIFTTRFSSYKAIPNNGEKFPDINALRLMAAPVEQIRFFNNPYSAPKTLETLVLEDCVTFHEYYKKYSVFWHHYSDLMAIKRIVYRREDGSNAKVIIPMVRESTSEFFKPGRIDTTDFYNHHYLNSDLGVGYSTLDTPTAFVIAEGEKVCDWLLYNWQVVALTISAHIFAKMVSAPLLGIEAIVGIMSRTKGIKDVLYFADNDSTGMIKATLMKTLLDHLGYRTWIVCPALLKADWSVIGHPNIVMDVSKMVKQKALFHSKRLLDEVSKTVPRTWDIADNEKYSRALFLARLSNTFHGFNNELRLVSYAKED
jgi:hypothetical protein